MELIVTNFQMCSILSLTSIMIQMITRVEATISCLSLSLISYHNDNCDTEAGSERIIDPDIPIVMRSYDDDVGGGDDDNDDNVNDVDDDDHSQYFFAENEEIAQRTRLLTCKHRE